MQQGLIGAPCGAFFSQIKETWSSEVTCCPLPQCRARRVTKRLLSPMSRDRAGPGQQQLSVHLRKAWGEGGNHRPSSLQCHQHPPQPGCPAQAIGSRWWSRELLECKKRGQVFTARGGSGAPLQKHPLQRYCGSSPVVRVCPDVGSNPGRASSASSQQPPHSGIDCLLQAPDAQPRPRHCQ